jgi:hypothetical protein
VILRCARNDQSWRGGYRNSKLADGERTDEDMTQDGGPGKPKKGGRNFRKQVDKGCREAGVDVHVGIQRVVFDCGIR